MPVHALRCDEPRLLRPYIKGIGGAGRRRAVVAGWVAAVVAAGGACGDDPVAIDAGIHPDASVALVSCDATAAELIAAALAVAPAAGSQGYRTPSAADVAALSDSIARVDDVAAAQDRAAVAGYQLCAIDVERVAWRPVDASSGHAVIAYHRGLARGLVVEAPHPLFDTDTAGEAALVFEQLTARAVIVSGTHRCAAAGAPSGCDGTTTACGTSAPHPISDMAHAVDSQFHAAHLALVARHPGDWIVSVHGMTGDGVHVSDGTTLATDAQSPVARIANALAAELPGEPILSCNAFPGAMTTSELCGTTNAQGRAVNGSANACNEAATGSSGRSLHVEQSRAVRDQAARVAAALDAVVP